jgi:putative membrane protein
MKYLARIVLYNMFALWITSLLLPTITVTGSWQAFLVGAVTLSLLMLVVAPVLRILFIPVNILTFGLLSWVINVIVLYLLTVFVSDVRIVPWEYSGGHWQGFVLPQMTFSYPVALIVSSFCLTFFSNTLRNVTES